MIKRKDPKAKDVQRDENQARRQIARLEMTDPGSPPCATAIYDSTKPHDSPVFLRGEAENRGDIAPAAIFGNSLRAEIARRSTTAADAWNWPTAIVSPNNPLTARVLVNRVWLHHFGQGIVTTPDDFGNQSDPPSHPELLDYLALSLHAGRLVHQETAPPHHALQHLPAEQRQQSALRPDRSAEPPVLAGQHPSPGIRGHPGLHPRLGGTIGFDDRRAAGATGFGRRRLFPSSHDLRNGGPPQSARSLWPVRFCQSRHHHRQTLRNHRRRSRPCS